MIYTVATKKGMGIELWGTHDDLANFHSFMSEFWNEDGGFKTPGTESRDSLISGFSYEVRKAYEGNRLKRKNSHFSFEEQEHFGTKLSWVQVLFSLAAIKYNMSFKETTKYDISTILNFEFWLEKSVKSYDAIAAKNLLGFINGGLYGANEYIYLFMRGVNLDYFRLGGGKRAFRKLPELLKRGTYFSKDYRDYKEFLENEAQRNNCKVEDLELNDDQIDYENIDW